MTGAGRVGEHDPVRVLHVVESWPPVVSGYTTRSARLIGAQADHLGLHPSVAVSSRQHIYAKSAGSVGNAHSPSVELLIQPETGRERLARRWRRFSIDPAGLERFVDSAIDRCQPDLVHVHWSSTIGRRALRAGHRRGIPVVCEVRFDLAGAMVSQTGGGRLTPLEPALRTIFDRHVMRADAVIAASHSLGELLKQRFSVQPIVVENAVDPVPRVEPSSSARGALGVADDTVLVGAISNLLAYEGFDRLIDACARIRSRGFEVRPVLVGAGPERDRLLRRAARLGVDLIAPGLVPASDVGWWYAMIDLVVVPRHDRAVTRFASPLKVLEAMAHGAPVIASGVGDISLLLADGRGRVVDAEDDRSLDAAIEDLAIDAAERARMADRARRWAESSRGWGEAARQHHDLYRDILSSQ